MKIKLLIAALCLSACQTAPMSFQQPAPQMLHFQRANVQQSVPFFPEQVGTHWDYAVTLAPTMDPLAEEKGSYTMLLENVKPSSQGSRLEIRAQSGFNNYYSFPTLIQGPQGLQLQDMTFLGIGSDAVRGLKINFLELPSQAKQRWEDENWIGYYKGQETVRVPAGEFKCTRISVIGTFNHAYTAVGDYWLAPGMGVVKSDLNVPGYSVVFRIA